MEELINPPDLSTDVVRGLARLLFGRTRFASLVTNMKHPTKRYDERRLGLHNVTPQSIVF